MPTAAEEIKAQYSSNRKQIARDYKKIDDLGRSILHSSNISECNQMQDDMAALHRGIADMNKQNKQAIERLKEWWRD